MSSRFARRRLRVAVALVVALGAGAAGATAVGQTQASDPITASRWSITIDGFEIATFAELAGIVSEVEPTEYMATDDREIVLNKLPGKLKPPTITLKRGQTSGMELWAWHEAVRNGQIAQARKSASLTAFNTAGEPVAKYWLEKAWPSKIEVEGLKAGRSVALVETVTLVAEYLQRISPS